MIIRNTGSGIIECDVHGMTVAQAVEEIQKVIDQAGTGVYRVRVIHGFHGGQRIQREIREEFSYGRTPKVKRIAMGNNQGITELVLRDY